MQCCSQWSLFSFQTCETSLSPNSALPLCVNFLEQKLASLLPGNPNLTKKAKLCCLDMAVVVEVVNLPATKPRFWLCGLRSLARREESKVTESTVVVKVRTQASCLRRETDRFHGIGGAGTVGVGAGGKLGGRGHADIVGGRFSFSSPSSSLGSRPSSASASCSLIFARKVAL